MPTGILVPNDEADIPAFAARAESLGYDSVWVNELWTRDAFIALTQAATQTEDIRLGTAIVNVYGRSPATLAQAAATLERAAGDRIILGLGTSTKKVVEDLHGMTFDNPIRRLHETTELTREFLRGQGRVSYEGKMFEVADFPALGSGVPVYTAALGPAARRATGRTADGWLPHNIPLSTLNSAFETIAETAEEVGRDPAEIQTAPYVPAAVDDDPERARDALRGHLAYYIGSGEGYLRAVASEYEEAEAIAEAWSAGERGEARELVTDAMVSDLGVAGTPADAREQWEAVLEIDVVDEPLVVVPNGVRQELKEQTVAALAPSELEE